MVLPAPPQHREVSAMSQSPMEIRYSELQMYRNQVANGLRDLADLLDATRWSEFPTPNLWITAHSQSHPTDSDEYNEPSLTLDDIRTAMAATPGRWSKLNMPNEISYTKTINDAVRYHLYVNRANVCTRIQIGTKHIDAKPAHDEPLYEWRCNESEPEV